MLDKIIGSWRIYVALVALAGAAVLALAFQRIASDRDRWRALANSITVAIRDASGNSALTPQDAAAQAFELGRGLRAATGALERQTAAVRALEAKAIENRERGERYRRQLAAAQAQRAAVIRQFELAADDATRRDCVAELTRMDELIDALRNSGF